jgi:hypothetical protein
MIWIGTERLEDCAAQHTGDAKYQNSHSASQNIFIQLYKYTWTQEANRVLKQSAASMSTFETHKRESMAYQIQLQKADIELLQRK